jgi:hypothetical protein
MARYRIKHSFDYQNRSLQPGEIVELDDTFELRGNVLIGRLELATDLREPEPVVMPSRPVEAEPDPMPLRRGPGRPRKVR